MKLAFLIVLSTVAFGILVYVLAKDTPITNYPPQNETIVAFGDSLVFGYGATPGNDFVSELGRLIGRPIVNLGVSGDTTADGLTRVDEALAYDPGIVIILLGGNDYLRRISEETTKENLAQLIGLFQDSGAVVVLLGVRSGVLISGRDDMYEELSDTYSTVYVDDVLDGIFGNAERMHDGIHPNDVGYRIIANRLAEVFHEYEL